MLRWRLVAGSAAFALVAMGGAGAGHAVPAAKAPTVCAKGCPYSTIQAAVDAAPDGATITVGPGVYAGGVTIDKSVALVGAGAKRTVVAGDPSGSVIEAVSGSIGIRGLTIRGGAIGIETVFWPAVTVRNSVITGNGTGAGGFGAGFAFRDSVIAGNAGPAVGDMFSGGVELTNTWVSDNGGGVHGNSRTTVVVRDSTIARNADSGILMFGGDLEVSGSTIRGNSAPNGGGIALYIGRGGAWATVADSTIRHNTASAKGGGVFMDVLTSLTLRKTKVSKNAALRGGGIYNGGAWSLDEPNFFSLASRIWNNTPDDYLEECDPLVWHCPS